MSLPHRSSSGRVGDCWEFDPETRRVFLVVAGRAFDVPVASETNPVAESYKISRLSEYVWQLAPSAFYYRRGTLLSQPRKYPHEDDAIEFAEFIALTCAPDEINAELEKL